ncbi:MAG: UPF0175 family protein [Spirochaetota bacterium]|nr:UPF0175 family protein [Spirochaetota bacterium]
MNTKIVLEIPDEILISMKETSTEFAHHLCMAAAVKLYQMGKLSSGRAAQLAGIPRVAFLYSLSEYGIPIIDLTHDELTHDLANA